MTRTVAREVMVRTPLFARILSQFWLFDAVAQAQAPAPEVRNTDDEAMVFCEARFPLTGDEARVAAVLDGIEEFEREEDGEPRWRWVAAGSPFHRAARHRKGRAVTESSEHAIGTTSLGYTETRKGTLVLSVNSQERAGRGRELLASRLGDLVGPALIAIQTPERALEEGSEPAGPDEPAIPPVEAVQAIRSYLDDHYRRTLDDPLPMLDSKALRERVNRLASEGNYVAKSARSLLADLHVEVARRKPGLAASVMANGGGVENSVLNDEYTQCDRDDGENSLRVGIHARSPLVPPLQPDAPAQFFPRRLPILAPGPRLQRCQQHLLERIFQVLARHLVALHCINLAAVHGVSPGRCVSRRWAACRCLSSAST